MEILPDLLAPGLAVVFCGTGAGRRSAETGTYYAGPGNRFWAVLHESGLIGRPLLPAEFRALAEFGIGLTDVAKHHVGMDEALVSGPSDREALAARIAAAAPRFLAFTSKKAAALFLARPTGALPYGPLPGHLGRTRLWVLPSPSGAARRYWSPEPWRQLAMAVAMADPA